MSVFFRGVPLISGIAQYAMPSEIATPSVVTLSFLIYTQRVYTFFQTVNCDAAKKNESEVMHITFSNFLHSCIRHF